MEHDIMLHETLKDDWTNSVPDVSIFITYLTFFKHIGSKGSYYKRLQSHDKLKSDIDLQG